MSSIVREDISIDLASDSPNHTDLKSNNRTALKNAKVLMMAVMSDAEAAAFIKAMRPNQESFLPMALKFQDRLIVRFEQEEARLFENGVTKSRGFTLSSFTRRRSALIKEGGSAWEGTMRRSTQQERDALDAAVVAKRTKKIGPKRKAEEALEALVHSPEEHEADTKNKKTAGMGLVSWIGASLGVGDSKSSSGT